jgi:nicotinamidase-related amidase
MPENSIRSHADNAVLIVIDMQEKLVPAMHEIHSLIHNTETLVRGCALMDIPVVFTQQYTKGLGETIEPVKNAYVETVQDAKGNVRYAIDDQLMARPGEEVVFSHIEKTTFSAMDEPVFVNALKGTGRREAIICGIESHVCVMQTAEDMHELGYAVRVAADAVASRQTRDYELACSRMTQEGITVTTSEALLFDLMKDSNHPLFRQISALVR